MRQERIGLFSTISPTGVDQSAGQSLRALAGLSEQVGDIAFNIGAKKRQKEGQIAGANVQRDEEGQIVAPELKSDLTIFGESFNKSAVLAYKAQIGLDAKSTLEELQNTHKLDPEAFKKQAEAAKQGSLAKMPEEIAIEAGLEYDIRIASHYSALMKDFYKRETEDQQAVIKERVNSMVADISTASRSGDTVAVELLREKLYEDIDQLGLPVDKSAALKRDIHKETLEQAYRKGFADMLENDGVEVAQKSLNSLIGKAPKEWSADEWQTYINSQQADINRHIAKQRAESIEERKQAQEAITQYENAASLGFDVSADQKHKVKELVSDTPFQERFNRVNKVASFSVLSNADRNAELSDARTGELEDVADYAAMIKANSEINKAATKDGYLLGVQQGLIEHVNFDASNPETIRLRLEQTDMLSEHYGVSISPLTDSEADGLSDSINEMTVDEKVILATTLNEAPDVWGQISEKNQSVFAMAGATGDKQLMSLVFKGQELLNEKLVTPISSEYYLPVLDDYLGDVYGTQDKSAILQTAKNHYAATSNDEGIFDEDAFEDSLNAVTGGIGEINGYKLELPRGTDEDDFEDFIESFTPSEVEKLGGVAGYTNEEAAESIQDGRIKSIGANKYVVMVNDVQALFKQDGNPLVIEWSEEAMSNIRAESFVLNKRFDVRKPKYYRGFK